MIFHAFLIKYAEIAIKGKNRYIFEDALVKQMNIALSKVEGEFEVKKEQGRIYVFCPEQYDYDETVEALQHVFGIVGICPVVIYEDQGFEQMAKDVVSYMKNRRRVQGWQIFLFRHSGAAQPPCPLHYDNGVVRKESTCGGSWSQWCRPACARRSR